MTWMAFRNFPDQWRKRVPSRYALMNVIFFGPWVERISYMDWLKHVAYEHIIRNVEVFEQIEKV